MVVVQLEREWLTILQEGLEAQAAEKQLQQAVAQEAKKALPLIVVINQKVVEVRQEIVMHNNKGEVPFLLSSFVYYKRGQ